MDFGVVSMDDDLGLLQMWDKNLDSEFPSWLIDSEFAFL